MSDVIQFYSRTGDDGVLNVRLDLGRNEARKDVVVTVQPISSDQQRIDAASVPWPDFIEQTYGSCQGLGLERQPQGDFEQREPIGSAESSG
ncbi:MAG: hypothetical protein WD669_10700 [Pirellulales bacterium]